MWLHELVSMITFKSYMEKGNSFLFKYYVINLYIIVIANHELNMYITVIDNNEIFHALYGDSNILC